jgi:hypothetical protein
MTIAYVIDTIKDHYNTFEEISIEIMERLFILFLILCAATMGITTISILAYKLFT